MVPQKAQCKKSYYFSFLNVGKAVTSLLVPFLKLLSANWDSDMAEVPYQPDPGVCISSDDWVITEMQYLLKSCLVSCMRSALDILPQLECVGQTSTKQKLVTWR